MTIKDFDMPTEHPYGIQDNYEDEGFMAWMLMKCIEAGDFVTIATSNEEPKMVEIGLLEKHGDRLYSLTKKAKGLLWSVYGKEEAKNE